MRLLLVIFIVLCQWAPTTAKAGAWLREQGTTFTATTFSATYFRDIASTTYMEHGLRDDLTLGLDVGYFTSRFGEKTGFGTLFMRRPLGPNSGSSKLAYEVGIGTAWVGDLVLPHVKAGVSWGRGFEIGDRNGWMAVDASLTWDIAQGNRLSKVDATIGLGLSDTTKTMVQVYLSHLNGDFFGTVAPSFVYSPPQSKFSIQFGAEAPVNNFDNTALKIGIWREF